MIRNIFAVVFSVLISLGTTPLAFAQTEVPEVPEGESEMIVYDTAPALECFDYYSPNNIKTTFEAVPTSVAPNETVTFAGEVANMHLYPLVDVTLHVKIFKRDEQASIGGYGDTLVTQTRVAEGLSIPAEGTLSASYDWVVPSNAEGGAYYAVFFVTAGSDDFTVMGYSSFDDVVLGQVDFSVVHDGYTPVVSFDRTTATLNNEPYLALNPPLVAQDVPSEVSIVVVNPTNEIKRIPIQWNAYTTRTVEGNNLVDSKTELLVLEPNEKKEVLFTSDSKSDGVVYVTGLLQDGDAKEYFNMTITRAGFATQALELPIVSLSRFPLVANEPTALFGCLTLLSEVAPQNVTDVIMTLTDEAGEIIHQYQFNGALQSQHTSVGELFTPTKNYDFATLSVEVQHYGAPVLQTSVTYDCKSTGAHGCEDESSILGANDATGKGEKMLFFGLVVLIAGVLALVILKKKKSTTSASTTTTFSIVFGLVLFSMSLIAPTAHAQCTTPPVAQWDCYASDLVEGPYAPSSEYACVPDGGSYGGCFTVWGSYYQYEYQTHNNVSSIPPGYASCVSYCPVTPPAATGNISGVGCSIAAGASTCSGSVNWSSSNASSPTVRNDTTGTQYSTAVSGNISASLQQGSNSVVLRNSSTVLASTNLTASCVSGTSWNGSVCVAAPPPPATGNISGTNCTIPAGSSSCVGTATWSTANASSPNARNNTTGVQISTSPSGSNVAVALIFGSNSVVVRNSTSVLASTNLTASCVSGTSWNGSICAVPPASATISGSGCTIASGASTCNGSLTWSISNASSPNVYNFTRAIQHSTAVSGSGSAIPLTNGVNTIQARNSTSVLASTNLTASCVSGTSWNGSSCVPPPPPSPSATISGSGCTIASGASTCNGSLTWTTSSVPSPNVYNTTRALQYSTNANGTGVAVALTNGVNTVAVRNSTTILASTNLTASCVSGTSWNGSSCVPPPPAASATISGSGCTISANGNSCTASLTWNFSNTSTQNVHNITTGLTYSNSVSGTNVNAVIAYGNNTIAARTGTTNLAQTSLTASCVSGTSWNGSVCAAASCTYDWIDRDQGYPLGGNCVHTYDPTAPPPATPCTSSNVGQTFGNGEACSSDVIDVHYWECRSSCGNPPPTPPTPPVSATISGSGCTIASGASTCNGSLTWDIINAALPNMRNTNTATQYSTNGSGSGVSVSLQYGDNTIAARDGNSTLRTTTLTTSCASGTTWDGSACTPVPPSTCAPSGSRYEWNGSAWVPNGPTATWNWDITAVGGNPSTPPPNVPVDELNPYGMDVDQLIIANNGYGSAYICGGAMLPPRMDLQINGSDGPVGVNSGDTLNLSWTGTSVSNCQLWGAGWVGGQPVAASGNQTVSATVSSNYMVVCTEASDQVQVNVAPPAPTATLRASIAGAPWSTAASQQMSFGQSLAMQWSSTNADSCTGVNVTTSNNTSGTDSGVTTPAAGNSLTYSVTCTNISGSNTATIQVATLALANLNTPNLTGTLSANFDPVTGNYEFAQASFNTSNVGATDITIPTTYLLELDLNDDGVIDRTKTGSLNQILAGATHPIVTEPFTDIPFGSHRITVTVDSDDDVNESNETDNSNDVLFAVPPPDPGLSLNIRPSTLIRTGDSVDLEWSIASAYPTLSCTLSGPSLSAPHTINPSAGSGTRTTGPITAKSDYTLSCTESITNTVFNATQSVETTGTVEEI